jgi:hypothetical protein
MTELRNTTDVVVVSSTTTSSIVEELYEEIKRLLHGGKLTTSNVVVVVINLMRLVEKYSELKGHQKKQVILEAVKMLINDSNDNVEDNEQLIMLVNMTLPSVIDVIISIDRKKIKIKIKKAWKFMLSCCGCGSS